MKEMLQRVRFSMFVKLIFVAILVAGLGVPLLMIDSIIDERQTRRAEAEREVSQPWGGAQVVGGPILAVPYLQQERRHMAYVLPDSLTVTAAVTPEIRYRSIYEVILYTGTITLTGGIPLPAVAGDGAAAPTFLWSEAELLVALSDMRGISENVRLQLPAGERLFEPALQNRVGKALGGAAAANPGDDEWHAYRRSARQEDGAPGVTMLRAPLALAAGPDGVLPFTVTLNLKGSGKLQFLPLGRETRVVMQSPWPDPSFGGAFLPTTRTITGDGFAAEWQVYYLSRNIPQQWSENELADIGAGRSAFGVEFIYPVDNYQRATRAVKYGMMFIVLTFLAFFLFEVLQNLRIHPVQYVLIGAALCLFYLLLLSLSEHLGFGTAYGLAALGIVLMIGGYCWAVLRTFGRALLMAAITAVLYGYLFVLLQLQDYALLCGSLGLFIILGLVMYVTRRINWYNPGDEGGAAPRQDA